jgi:hypothetical protein
VSTGKCSYFVRTRAAWNIAYRRRAALHRARIVGLREVDDQIWLVSFLNYDLGFFDRENDRVKPAPNPFAPERCKPSLRYPV